MPESVVKKNKDELITPGKASIVLGVSQSSVYKMISSGRLDSWRQKGTRRIFLDRKQVESLAGNNIELVKVNPDTKSSEA